MLNDPRTVPECHEIRGGTRMIGQRLKLARAAAGLTQRALEAGIGRRVTAEAISKYERNETMPGSGVLMALAAALDVSVDYLVGDQDIVLEGIECRTKRRIGRRGKARIEATMLHRAERYLNVEELLGLPAVAWDKPRAAPYPVAGDPAAAEHGARSLRDHWGVGFDPIPNMAELLEERGITVLETDLTDIGGLTVRVRCGTRIVVPVIVVKRTAWGERQRFTMAHELGHLVLDLGPQTDAENAAQRFAGAFLMPADALRAAIGKHRTSIGWSELFDLKRLFGVSVQSLTQRCQTLGVFTNALCRRLFSDFSRLGWTRPPFDEPCPVHPEQPGRFERLCVRAVAEGAISESKAAELLSITVRDLNGRMEQPPEGDAAVPSSHFRGAALSWGVQGAGTVLRPDERSP